MKHPLQKKSPRYHAGLDWESKVLTNDFIDINRMALDDRYSHVAAPYSKRRGRPIGGRGTGKAGDLPGLYGIGSVSGVASYDDERRAYIAGSVVAAGSFFAMTLAANSKGSLKATTALTTYALLGGLFAHLYFMPPKN